MGKKLILTRDVTPEECSWLAYTHYEGDEVFAYHGHTYGCISSGIACSEKENETPFFELPKDAVKLCKGETSDPPQKPVYRIWDKTRKKYLSPGYKSKKQWDSLGWCISAAKDNFKQAVQNDEIEIHTLELVVKKRENPKIIIQEKKRKEEEKERLEKERRKNRAIAEDMLTSLVPGEPVYNIISLYKRGYFNEKLMGQLKEGIEEFKKYS